MKNITNFLLVVLFLVTLFVTLGVVGCNSLSSKKYPAPTVSVRTLETGSTILASGDAKYFSIGDTVVIQSEDHENWSLSNRPVLRDQISTGWISVTYYKVGVIKKKF